MSINSVGGSSVSWAQFITATQAARQRNSALTVGNAAVGNAPANTTNAAKTVVANPVMSPKAAQNVYSTYGQINKRPEVSAVTPRSVGGVFDAYA